MGAFQTGNSPIARAVLWKVLPHSERCCIQDFFFFSSPLLCCLAFEFLVILNLHFRRRWCISELYDWDSVPGYGHFLMALFHQHQAGNADKRWMIVHAWSVWEPRGDAEWCGKTSSFPGCTLWRFTARAGEIRLILWLMRVYLKYLCCLCRKEKKNISLIPAVPQMQTFCV